MKGLDVFWDSTEASVEEYEELLCRRDQLNKEAGSLQITYTQEFGELITQIFEKKVECIKKKKMIAYCQKQINRGEPVYANLMNETINKEMQLYYYQLDELVRQTKEAKEAREVDPFCVRRAKKIYRRLAKMLHPDINRFTMEEPVLRELWERVASAYYRSEVTELEDLEVLARKVMEDLGMDGFDMEIEVIAERIERVEKQINEILTTEPYTYREVLYNDEKKKELKEKFSAEDEEYRKYVEELSETLEELLKNGGMSFVWKMN